MVGVLFLIILFFGLNQVIFFVYEKRHPFFDRKKMNLLYLYHLVFYGLYYWQASLNPSDSHHYYEIISTHRGSWFELFGTDTNFIHFVGYPLYKLGFSSYEMMMMTFAWFGYLGFIYAYLFFRENIPIKIKVFGNVDFLTLILFFPNMHFWTASLGKGGIIFLGLMMFTYAVIKPKTRKFLLILGSIITFYIRPHMFLFLGTGAVLGYMSGKEKIPLYQKLLIYFSFIGALIFAQDDILAVVNLQNSEDLISDFQEFAGKRTEDLAEAGSGINIQSYPLPLKLFTFWFRPLFFDAPSVLGVLASFENLIYLILFLKIIKKDFFQFIKKSPVSVKMSLTIFFATSFAMTFIVSNLGIIMRQKSMIMYYIFFVIYYYLAEKKYLDIMRRKRLRTLAKERMKNENNYAS